MESSGVGGTHSDESEKVSGAGAYTQQHSTPGEDPIYDNLPTGPATTANRTSGLSVEQVPFDYVDRAFQLYPQFTTPFSRPDILETISRVFGRPIVTLGIKNQTGLEGVAPLLIRKKGPFKIAQRLPVRYIGIITEAENVLDELISVTKTLREKGVVIAYYSFPPQVKLDVQKLRCAGFEAEHETTYLLPLKGGTADEVLQVAQPRMRSSVRQALRKLDISDATREETENRLCPMLEATYNRKERVGPPYPPDMGSTLWNRHRNGSGVDPTLHIRTARLKTTGEAVGMMVAITHPSTGQTYSWAIAREPGFDNLQVSGALIADMGAIAAREGSKEFDLGGGTEGIKEFKRRLGGEPAEYTDIRVSDRRYKIAQAAHEKFSEAMERVSAFLGRGR
jgi:Acetyltransferase (GNAT) domain